MNGFAEREQRIQDATALKTPDRVPIALAVSGVPFFLSDKASYKDVYYDHAKATEAIKDFYREFLPDTYNFSGMVSGKSNEVAGSTMIDWPGKPGVTISDYSTHQVLEHEYMSQEEYPELLSDFTGFMLRKYIPRAFPGLAGLQSIAFNPQIVLSTTPLGGLYSEGAFEAYDKLREIAKTDAEAAAATAKLVGEIAEIGIPCFMHGAGQAPFDILGDYYRSTLGLLEDQVECPDMIAKACELFADLQIEGYKKRFGGGSGKNARIFFPLHKGMDGFMSDEQYKTLYWEPLRRVMMALIDLGVTPIIYTEGAYDTRLECLADVPKGKVIYHFENVDIARAKKVLGNVACISGNFPVYYLEYSSKERVIEETKKLLDICAPGGGYIFDTNMYVDNVKRENLEAMFETVKEYGKY